MHKAWHISQEIEALGRHGEGDRDRHSQDAHRRGGRAHGRRRSTAGAETIVGVNKYQLGRSGEIDVLEVDNKARARIADCGGWQQLRGRRAIETAVQTRSPR